MALTRSQLLMGNSSQGVVLTGQVQGVRQGAGLLIAPDGTISFDSTTATGVLKTNNPSAYNSYIWPTSLGTTGQQLTITVGNIIQWEDPDQIPWTTKGQLLVGTGPDTAAFLNVGVDGSILIGDSTTVTGLNYTTNYVPTTGSTSAANLPFGPTGTRPAVPPQGAIRYNNTTTNLEFYDGTSWEQIASSPVNSFVEQTGSTGSAVMPAGTTAQRNSAPVAGFMRFNDDSDLFEFWNGASWQSIASSTTGLFIDKTNPPSGTASAIIPPGTTAQQQPSPAPGYLRYNTDINDLEFYNGSGWIVAGGVISFSGGTTGLTPSSAAVGSVVLGGTLNLANGGTGATTQPAAINNLLPAQAGNVGFYLQTDGTNVSWTAISGAVTSFSAGTTGLSPAVATTGAIVLGGTLNLANGGTGATTQPTAINNLLPSQGGAANKFLSTDGTNALWASSVTAITAGTNLGAPTTGAIITNTGTINLLNDIDLGSVNATGTMLGPVAYQTNGTWIRWNATAGTGATTFQNQRGLGAGGFFFSEINSDGSLFQPLLDVNTTGTFIQNAAGADAIGLLPTGEFQVGTAGALSSGLNNQVLKSQGAGVNPLWAPSPRIPAPGYADIVYSASQNISGVIYANNITVNAGIVLLMTGMVVQFVCTGNVVINGTIIGDEGGSGSRPLFIGVNIGGADTIQQTFTNGYGPGSNRGEVGSPNVYTPAAAVIGSAGGNGAGIQFYAPASTGLFAAASGASGGTLIITAMGSITMGGSASIQLSGGNAISAAPNVGATQYVAGGAGGGSGGCLILHSYGGAITTAGTISATGGFGSSGVTDTGFYAGGGGGGAGGVIVFQNFGYPFTDGATYNLGGGGPGATLNAGASGGIGGAFGGSFATVGGDPYLPNSSIFAATSGTAGVKLYNQSPFF